MSSPSEPVDTDFDVVVCAGVAEAHDRALAELLFDLAERGDERLLAIFFHHGDLENEWRGDVFSI